MKADKRAVTSLSGLSFVKAGQICMGLLGGVEMWHYCPESYQIVACDNTESLVKRTNGANMLNIALINEGKHSSI